MKVKDAFAYDQEVEICSKDISSVSVVLNYSSTFSVGIGVDYGPINFLCLTFCTQYFQKQKEQPCLAIYFSMSLFVLVLWVACEHLIFLSV